MISLSYVPIFKVSAPILNKINADFIKILIKPAMAAKFNERVFRLLH